MLEQNHLHGRCRRRIAIRAVHANHRGRRRIRYRQLVLQEVLARHGFRIPAQQNVRAAAGHVRRHGHGALASRLGHDARFALVLLGVQHLVRHSGFFQNVRNRLRLLDRNRAHQHRLPALVIVPDSVGQRIVFLQDSVHHRFEFFLLRAVNDVRMFFADQRTVRRNHHHVQVVNLSELRRFRFRRSGHARQFLVHAEIILKGDGRQGLVFPLDLHAFLGFDRLVQAVRPAPPRHLPPGELVDDDYFAVFHHVIHVVLVQRVRPQRLVNVVNLLHVRRVVQISQPQQPLALAHAFFRQRGRAMLFIQRVIDVLNQLGNNLVDLEILVGGFFGRPGNNQRRPRLVDQDRVHFVHNRELVPALHATRQVVLHVVAQVIESELVVRAVGQIRRIGRPALHVVQVMHDHADGQSQRLIQRAHPLRVAPRQVIVHRHDVHAAPGQRIQRRRQCRHERLPFARLHFGDFAVVQHHSADQLHVEMPHLQESPPGLAHQRKRRHNRVRQRLLQLIFVRGFRGIRVLQLLLHLRPQRREAFLQLLVAQRLHFRLLRIHRSNQRLQLFQVALVLRPDKPRDNAVNYLG